MPNDNDHAYKGLFANPEMVRDLITGFIHQPWVAGLDFDSLEKISGSYVTDDLRDREDDVIWRVRSKGQWLYIYLLLEFQSTVDRFMAVRILTYTGLLYQDLIKAKQLTANKKLPAIFPLVLYNGRLRWYASTDIKTLIEPFPEGLQRYQPNMQYLVLDEGAYTQAELDKLTPLKNLAAAVFRLENASDRDEIIKVLNHLTEWLHPTKQLNVLKAFKVWVNRVLFPKKAEKHDYYDLGGVRTMLAESVQEWNKEWIQQGIEQGIVQGVERGIVQGAEQGIQSERKLLLKLIEKQFGDSERRYAQPILAGINSYETLEQVGTWIIDYASAKDFRQKIASLGAKK